MSVSWSSQEKEEFEREETTEMKEFPISSVAITAFMGESVPLTDVTQLSHCPEPLRLSEFWDANQDMYPSYSTRYVREEHQSQEISKPLLDVPVPVPVPGVAPSVGTSDDAPSALSEKQAFLQSIPWLIQEYGYVDTRQLKSHDCNLYDLLENEQVFIILCRDRFGSRFIQKLIASKNTPAWHIQQLIDHIIPHAKMLCKDVFANFVIQKILEVTLEKTCDITSDIIRPGLGPKLSHTHSNESCVSSKSAVSSISGSSSNASTSMSPSPALFAHMRDTSDEEDNGNTSYGNNTNGNTYGSDDLPEISTVLCSKSSSSSSVSSVASRESNMRNSVKKSHRRRDYLIELGYFFVQKCLMGRVMELTSHDYSCRIIQRIMRYTAVHLPILIAFLNELTSDAKVLDTCMRHVYGNHILQKAVENIPHNYLNELLRKMRGKIVSYSADKFACRVMQRIISRCHPYQLKSIYNEMLPYILPLSQSQFGNYVIQHVLSVESERACPERAYLFPNGSGSSKRPRINARHGSGSGSAQSAVTAEHFRNMGPEEAMRSSQLVQYIVATLANKVYYLSCQKFASNVIEKCIEADIGAQMLTEALLAHTEQYPGLLYNLMSNRYGNYIIQRILVSSNTRVYKNRLQKAIQANCDKDKLKTLPWGSHLVRKAF